MLSLRVSVQRTGRPSLRASQTTSTSSTLSIFAPKPPPTSGATTRICSGSSPSVPASTIRSWCGVCVESQAVRRPSSPTVAAAERGSSGHGAMRWLTSVPETTTSHPSKSFSSCSGEPERAATFVPASGKRSTSSFAASCGLDDCGQRVVVDEDELGGVRAGGAVVADDDRDDVADEADAVGGERRAPHARVEPGERRRPERAEVQVGGREHLDVREGLGRAGVDAVDAGVREQRADEGDRERALEGQVLHVAALAAEEPRVLLAENPMPEDAHVREPIDLSRSEQPTPVGLGGAREV